MYYNYIHLILLYYIILINLIHAIYKKKWSYMYIIYTVSAVNKKKIVN